MKRRIIVSDIKRKTENFNELTNKFEELYLNKFTLINDNKEYWEDPHAMCYYEFKDNERILHDTTKDEHIKVIDIYTYICNRLTDYFESDKFIFEFEKQEQVDLSFDSYVKLIKEVTETSKGIVESACSNGDVGGELRTILEDIPDILKSCGEIVEAVQGETKAAFGYLSETEMNVSKYIEGITIKEMSELDYNGKVENMGEGIPMEYEVDKKLEETKISELVDLYVKVRLKEWENFNVIKELFVVYNDNYYTENTPLIKQLFRKLLQVYSRIDRNSFESINIYNKNIETYVKTRTDVYELFSNIDISSEYEVNSALFEGYYHLFDTIDDMEKVYTLEEVVVEEDGTKKKLEDLTEESTEHLDEYKEYVNQKEQNINDMLRSQVVSTSVNTNTNPSSINHGELDGEK